jgi:putative AdoMet-dependent methyltransferase
MMKIKDVADKLNISPSAIRFYEEKGLISPAKQDNNQYRTMSIEDIKKAMAGVEQEDKEQLQYYLELQRSVIFS